MSYEISTAELIDRLSICNCKLFALKNAVAESTDDAFKARAAEQDITLCRDRSAIKNELDARLGATGAVEVKQYGRPQ